MRKCVFETTNIHLNALQYMVENVSENYRIPDAVFPFPFYVFEVWIFFLNIFERFDQPFAIEGQTSLLPYGAKNLRFMEK